MNLSSNDDNHHKISERVENKWIVLVQTFCMQYQRGSF